MKLDARLIIYLNKFSNKNKLRSDVAVLFSTWLLWLLLLVVYGALWFLGVLREERFIVYLGLSLMTSAGVSYILKNMVDRPRPFVRYKLVTALIGDKEPYLSFPSSHTAVAVALMVGVLMLGRVIGIPLSLYILVSVSALCIGVGRIMVGVHYPVDVIAGAFVGWLSAYSWMWIILR